jgi:hypothetical protein
MSYQNLTTRVQDISCNAASSLASADQVTIKNLYVSGAQISPNIQNVTIQSVTAAAPTPLSAAQLKSGFIQLTGTPGEAFDITLSTAALLVASIANCKVGDSFSVLIQNLTTGGFTGTVISGSGVTRYGTQAIANASAALVKIVLTNVTALSEAAIALVVQ